MELDLGQCVIHSIDQSSSIVTVTLNRPHCLNAINFSLLDSLVSALRVVQASQIKVCIIHGAGTSFCSGEDLKETLAPRSGGTDPDELLEAFKRLQDVTRLMTCVGTIFIAAVRGWAVGGGAEIALAADIVIASPDATFKFSEIIHGHAPTGGITGRLPQLIGLQEAKRLLLLGENIPARKALSLNLIMEVTEDPLFRSNELASQLSQRSERSLAMIKKSIEAATFPSIEQTLDDEIKGASWCFAHKQASDAFETFRARKKNESFENVRAGETGETLISLLIRNSIDHPDQTFLRFGEFNISYSKFAEDVKYLADGLTKAGIREGDVIGSMMLNSEPMVRFWFAAMWIGAIWAPLHTEIRGLSLRRAIQLMSPKILIIDEMFSEHIPLGFGLHIYVNRIDASRADSWISLVGSSSSNPKHISPETLASLLFTSGTTGPSKACELSHSYFISAGRSLIDTLCLNSTDVLFCPFPLCHADATSLTVVPALLLCATAAISQKFSAQSWWNEICQTRATVADFMGATLSILFKASARPSDPDNPLRMMWGVPVPPWVEEFEKRFALKVYEVYGSTEMGIPVIQPVHYPRVKCSCGVAVKDAKLKLINEDGMNVQPGTVGELLVYQPPQARFSGYYKNTEATEKSLRDGWFYTGDLCRLDSDGNLYFVGRRKHVIRRRGENISAYEVEEALLLHPDILECAAYGVPSNLSEEDVKVSIVRRQGSCITEHAVYDFAVKSMARFQIPRYIEFVDALPRSPTHKLEIYKLQDAWSRGDRARVKDFDGHRSSRLSKL